ncbi:Exopolysaccharide biosynthesis protein [Streptococcus sp. ZB199]|nr:Exopolysaccharide biosynthesis protein [Streptococcus sp. ZB199]
MASNPRTAIGIIDENHYIIVVSDGRTSESEGLSLYQLAEVMKSYGVKTAYNLDGVDLLPFTSMAKLLTNQQQMVLSQKGR